MGQENSPPCPTEVMHMKTHYDVIVSGGDPLGSLRPQPRRVEGQTRCSLRRTPMSVDVRLPGCPF